TQRRFARYGFNCILPGEELRPYLVEGLFPSVWMTRSRVMLDEYEPRYPKPDTSRPLLVHSASSTARKGTDAVLAAVERLKDTFPGGFDFELIHGVSHHRSLEMVRRCDLFIDQFAAGSYGLAAVEAMALGKPVVGHVMPGLRKRLPSDLPIVEATQDSLAEVLASLIAAPHRRTHLGRQGRSFARRYHDAVSIARELGRHYEELLKGRAGM
ncbi:MAG: glycosyltransferase, partial [Planctomycetota bacterium]|nr:glycosyltransferase [Planctomycetota bacterium]